MAATLGPPAAPACPVPQRRHPTRQRSDGAASGGGIRSCGTWYAAMDLPGESGSGARPCAGRRLRRKDAMAKYGPPAPNGNRGARFARAAPDAPPRRDARDTGFAGAGTGHLADGDSEHGGDPLWRAAGDPLRSRHWRRSPAGCLNHRGSGPAYINLAVVGLNSETGQATLAISGNRVCAASCPTVHLTLLALDDNATQRLGLLHRRQSRSNRRTDF